MQSYGLRLSGIYRISGAHSRVKKLEEQFRTDPLNFEIDSTTFKVHDVAVLLKQFSDRYKNLDLTVASFFFVL